MRLNSPRSLFFAQVLPGGHLILKPFTATVTASFNRDDIMNSFLVDAGLRRLVARALSRRVRSVRDLFDGAVFYGRTWKLMEQNAPMVEVPKLQDVQFDKKNRLIITGRARIKAAPDAPFIENGFKLRTKIGTRSNGRIIGKNYVDYLIVVGFPHFHLTLHLCHRCIGFQACLSQKLPFLLVRLQFTTQ